MTDRILGVDCPWCGAPDALDVLYLEMGVRHCACGCCSQLARVNHDGQVYRTERRRQRVLDVSGNVMYDP